MAHWLCTHGPVATMACSQAMAPWSVTTAVTAPEASRSKPRCSTPVTRRTSSASALAHRPLSDAMLLA